jgi:protein TonB
VLTSLKFERTPWTVGIAVSLFFHSTIAAALILTFNFNTTPQSAPVAPLVVELARLPTAPVLPKSDIAIGAKQEQQTKSLPKPIVKRLPFDPPPEAPTALSPLAIQKQQNQPQSDLADKTIEQTTAPVAVNANQERELAAPLSAAARQADADAQASWESRLLAKLESKKRYPRACQARHEEDVVYVKFVLNRQGEVLPGSAIVRSNGYPLLDSEVLDLLKRASPLPPPPPEVHEQQIELVVPVEFYIHVASR